MAGAILSWTPYTWAQHQQAPWWSSSEYLTPYQLNASPAPGSKHQYNQPSLQRYATHVDPQNTQPVAYGYTQEQPQPQPQLNQAPPGWDSWENNAAPPPPPPRYRLPRTDPAAPPPSIPPSRAQRGSLSEYTAAEEASYYPHHTGTAAMEYPYPQDKSAEALGHRAPSAASRHRIEGDSADEGPEEEEEKTFQDKCCACFKHNVFLLFLLFGIVAGIGMGIGIRYSYPEFGTDKRNVMYLEFPGKLLLRMLKMTIIPLIVSSLISGMASIPGKAAGRLGGLAVMYYMITTFMAVLLGILLVSLIQPGNRAIDKAIKEDKDKLVEPVDALLDLIRNAFPDNIVGSCFTQTRTSYDTIPVTYETNNSWGNETINATMNQITGFSIGTVDGTNVLGLVMFSIGIGIIVGRMGEAGMPVRAFVDSFQEAIIQLVRLIIWYSPVGICFLLAGRIVGMANPEQAFLQLAWYMMTVLVGLGIHGFIILPIIYVIFARANPFKHLFHMTQALLTALGTASSSATLPITMGCLEDNAGVDRRVSRFMLPVGATINMDGTALYEAVASIFIAQVNNYDLDAGQLVTVSITATAAAIGAAGVPEAGLVTMVIVLTAIGLPTDEIGLIFAVDWFLDRFRTMINVWGDAVGAGVVAKLSKKQLEKMDLKEQAERAASKEGAHVNPAYIYDHNENTSRL